MNREQESKRFYWIKLKTDFYSDDNGAVAFLLGQPNGANYIVIYQMLCLMSANKNGELAYNVGEILVPYDVDKITRECKYFSRDTVITALSLYQKLGLVYQSQEGTLVISNIEGMVGSETAGAQKKRLQRSRANKEQKLLDDGDNYEDRCGDTEGDETGDTEGDNVPKRLEIRDKSIEYRDKRLDIYNSSLSTAREVCAREEESVSPDNGMGTGNSQADDGDNGESIEEAADGTPYAEFLTNWDISDKHMSRYAAERVVLIDWKKMDEKMRSSHFLQGCTKRGITYFINQSDRILAGEFDDDDCRAASRASPRKAGNGGNRKTSGGSIVDQIQWLKEQYRKEEELNEVDDG